MVVMLWCWGSLPLPMVPELVALTASTVWLLPVHSLSVPYVNVAREWYGELGHAHRKLISTTLHTYYINSHSLDLILSFSALLSNSLVFVRNKYSCFRLVSSQRDPFPLAILTLSLCFIYSFSKAFLHRVTVVAFM